MVQHTHVFLHTEEIYIMATSKTFTVVGVSTLNGKTKVRFANDFAGRIKNLVKGGHTNVELFELPSAMTKEAALAHVQANSLFTIPADTDVTADALVAVAGE
jgi:hypothetical protein